jgi:hypothetical protein
MYFNKAVSEGFFGAFSTNSLEFHKLYLNYKWSGIVFYMSRFRTKDLENIHMTHLIYSNKLLITKFTSCYR